MGSAALAGAVVRGAAASISPPTSPASLRAIGRRPWTSIVSLHPSSVDRELRPPAGMAPGLFSLDADRPTGAVNCVIAWKVPMATLQVLRGCRALAPFLGAAVAALSAISAAAEPAGRAAIAWHVTISPSWFDPS